MDTMDAPLIIEVGASSGRLRIWAEDEEAACWYAKTFERQIFFFADLSTEDV